jgi:hypothetical protein
MKSLLTPFTGLLACLSVSLHAAGAESLQPLLQSPLDYQIFQRSTREQGTIHLDASVNSTEAFDAYAARLLDEHGQVLVSTSGSLESAAHDFAEKKFNTNLKLDLSAKSGGWYRLEVVFLKDQKVVAQFVPVHVGVGEVFLVAGQSNSANHGAEKLAAKSEFVRTFTGEDWQHCKDPQPGASGNGGSFIPALGDLLQSRLHVPIGFIACGIGATSVREWLPEGKTFAHPPTLVNRVRKLDDGKWESNGQAYQNLVHHLQSMGKHGLRAVLWHQGESDANQAKPINTLSGANYRDYLGIIIGQSRHDIGWEIPWMVAQVSYHTPNDTGSEDIREGQAALWHDGIALQGPDTDALRGALREKNGQGVHFSAAGQQAHAQVWAEKLLPWIESQP